MHELNILWCNRQVEEVALPFTVLAGGQKTGVRESTENLSRGGQGRGTEWLDRGSEKRVDGMRAGGRGGA